MTVKGGSGSFSKARLRPCWIVAAMSASEDADRPIDVEAWQRRIQGLAAEGQRVLAVAAKRAPGTAPPRVRPCAGGHDLAWALHKVYGW